MSVSEPSLPSLVSLVEVAPSEDAALFTMAERIWPVAYGAIISPAQIEYMLEAMYAPEVLLHDRAKGIHFLWILVDGERAGFLAHGPSGEDSVSQLHKYYLLPEFQGRGIGSKAMSLLASELLAAGIRALELRVNRHNQTAIRFYQKNQFTIYAEDCQEIGGGFVMDDFLMRRVLSRPLGDRRSSVEDSDAAPRPAAAPAPRLSLLAACATLAPRVAQLLSLKEAASPALRRDLDKFAEEARLFELETSQFFSESAPLRSDDPAARRDFRHDSRNRLNHLFGLAQLMRLGELSSEFTTALNEVVHALESCLSTLADSETTPGSTSSSPLTPISPDLLGTLLIADDDPDNREILRRLLEPQGFDLVFAVNGAEVIEKMATQDFDAVLLDIQMPEMDGFEVLSRLRETGQLRYTPVIVVTGLQEEQDAVRCIENGAEDFLSRPIRPALLMARLSASLEKKRLRERVFEQHFTPELARELARNPDPMKMQARQADVSVMFCDIRGFSALSEQLGPSQTIAWLGGVMGEFSTIVIDHGGVLVDYTGDELLAMWGAPNEQPDHATLACQAGIEILRRLPALNQHWQPLVGAETQVGIGINSGEALVGNVGTHRKFKYGPLGTVVNLASRVQGATKFLKTSMLLTGETASRVHPLFPTRRLCRVRVQNIKTPVDLHELEVPGVYGDWPELTTRYEAALDAFEQGDLLNARDKLEAFLHSASDDTPARLLLDRIADAQANPSGPFDPIWSLPGK